MNNSSALVTGGAGFIGSHLVDSLMENGWEVTVVDNFDPYYDPAVKRENVAPHRDDPRYHLAEADIRDADALRSVFLGSAFDVIVHLAARAGVRASIDDPIACQQVNVTGTQHLLELAQEHDVPQFVFGSSSSVYGTNPDAPWSEEDHDLRPISPYASTKLSAEFLGHTSTCTTCALSPCASLRCTARASDPTLPSASLPGWPCRTSRFRCMAMEPRAATIPTSATLCGASGRRWTTTPSPVRS